jgi:hypothetical protein
MNGEINDDSRPLSQQPLMPVPSHSPPSSPPLFHSPSDLSPTSPSPFFASNAIGDLLRSPNAPQSMGGEGGAAPRPSGGIVWRKDWLGLASAFVAIVVLLAWIVAAAVLVAIDLFVPLDYFGGGIVTSDSYK